MCCRELERSVANAVRLDDGSPVALHPTVRSLYPFYKVETYEEWLYWPIYEFKLCFTNNLFRCA